MIGKRKAQVIAATEPVEGTWQDGHAIVGSLLVRGTTPLDMILVAENDELRTIVGATAGPDLTRSLHLVGGRSGREVLRPLLQPGGQPRQGHARRELRGGDGLRVGLVERHVVPQGEARIGIDAGVAIA